MTRLLPLTIAFLLGVLAGMALGAGPSSELRAAVQHARTLPINEASFTRYVSFYATPAEERADAEKVLSFVLNTVSRSARIIVPQRLPGSECVVINLAQYGIPVEVWESMLDTEFVWHLTTEILDPATGKKRKVLTDAGHLDLKEAEALRKTTGSGGALVRGDWLCVKLTTPPHYYNAAGIPATLDGWYKALGADPAAIVALKANRGANIIQSGVTKKVRRVSRWQGPIGAVWQTYDVFGDDARKDVLRNPTFQVEYDAGEHIAAKPNALHLFGLYDSKGNRQDTVPDKIAKDDSDPHGDGVLIAGVSCVRCHVEDGLRPFPNDQRSLDLKGVKILADASQPQDDLAAFYGLDGSGKLDRQLARDREDYAAAVKQATGMTSKELAEAFARVFRQYEYELVTTDSAKRELGVESLEPLKATGDIYLMALANGRGIPRRSWEQSYNSAALAVKGQP